MGTVSPESEPDHRQPPPRSKPPRSALTMRDMLVALAVLVPLILVFGSLSRCSFAPGGPEVDTGAVPVVDAPAELRRIAPGVPFEVRIPAVPADWRSNSADQDIVGGTRVVRTGFVLPDRRYLRLLQSDGAEAALLAVETGSEPVPGRGTVDVGAQRWVVYGADDDEPIWITEVVTPDAAPVRLLITGSGSEDAFRTLADAAVGGQVLPVGTAPR